MIAFFLKFFLGRHASLKQEVNRLTKMVEAKKAEQTAMQEERALLTQIAALRTEVGIS